ncbi:Tn7 transposase TnsA N-terminal domain-containing protein [Shewanella spartinae]|uniref:Tn7 transposase TnsA N-terminal domain-containing protein n=1 Tax=Shewanella spartinae TaxID=2864205 RepID=UPI001C65CD23|nr:Tn7 transposase TnsA N-terminal domain-containing protein [Shewanella spartinae]QYJ95705.1 Tn7 transposase TnsA N-terminal domain-containing protein [Shewanella spartinae]
MNTRRVPRKRRGRNVTWMFSAKNGQSIFIDSFLEQTYAYLLELSAEVKSYATQPESLHVRINGRKSTYTPDFLVANVDGSSYYVEVHHTEFINETFLSKMEAVSEHIKAHSTSGFIIVTNKDLPTELGENLKLITVNRNKTALQHVNVDTLPLETTFSDLHQCLSAVSSDPAGAIYELLAQQEYEYQECLPLNPDSLLRRIS